MSKVWLVTGSGSGLGRNITEAVLASGARLVATARDLRLDDVVKKYGDQVRTASLGDGVLGERSPILKEAGAPRYC